MSIIRQLPQFTLIIGGARSGKSETAETLAVESGLPVRYIATLSPSNADAEMIERIERHRKRRPPSWTVIEAPLEVHEAINNLTAEPAAVIIDCVSLLVSNLILEKPNVQTRYIEQHVHSSLQKLMASISQRSDLFFIVVTGEVGMGVIPENQMARLYADILGVSNQMLAAAAQEVWLVNCGLKIKLK